MMNKQEMQGLHDWYHHDHSGQNRSGHGRR